MRPAAWSPGFGYAILGLCRHVRRWAVARLAGAAGMVVETAFGVPTVTRLGVAKPQVRELAWLFRQLAGDTIFRGGRLPPEVMLA